MAFGLVRIAFRSCCLARAPWPFSFDLSIIWLLFLLLLYLPSFRQGARKSRFAQNAATSFGVGFIFLVFGFCFGLGVGFGVDFGLSLVFAFAFAFAFAAAVAFGFASAFAFALPSPSCL